MRLQPAADNVVFHREGRPELPAAAPIRDGEHHRADRRAYSPDDRPDRGLRRRRGSCLLRSGSRCCLRRHRKIRQGQDGCPFCRRGRAPRQQGIDAQCGRQRDRRQQPRERQKCLFRQPFDRERTDDRDDQDHDAAREAHLQELHTRRLIPARRRSAAAARAARRRAFSAPAGPRTACRQSRHRSC